MSARLAAGGNVFKESISHCGSLSGDIAAATATTATAAEP